MSGLFIIPKKMKLACKLRIFRQAWWPMLLVPVLWSQRQEDPFKFKASLRLYSETLSQKRERGKGTEGEGKKKRVWCGCREGRDHGTAWTHHPLLHSSLWANEVRRGLESFYKTLFPRSEERAPWLECFTALTEDWDFVPNSHMMDDYYLKLLVQEPGPLFQTCKAFSTSGAHIHV